MFANSFDTMFTNRSMTDCVPTRVRLQEHCSLDRKYELCTKLHLVTLTIIKINAQKVTCFYPLKFYV